ncbi:hypothetical protein CLIB1444_04S02828 [[Candida] jaroonii]|uniref:Uncharacterized protein n=1 Tax=[Candida] jaroonii TaxID=467808 RepID=A0ACA9Y719_9ASCO|nr:hypothetical protein CLIB1444_04S02828 [[Candida] jaroonii]
MSEQFKFNRAESDSKIIEVLGIANDHPQLNSQQFGESLLKTIKKDTNKHEIYYLEHKSTKEIVCCVELIYNKGFYKDVDKGAITSTPDPDLFGVKHVTVLQIARLLTAPKFDSLGMSNKLITQVVEYVEGQLIKDTIASSKDKKGGFAEMVVNDQGNIDTKLAHYYLSKQYFWIIYSAKGNYYERFGFKAFPVEMFKIPTSIANHQKDLIETLMTKGSHTDPNAVGKKLRLLDFTKLQDRDLISFMLQGKELEILTELNKSIFHSELSNGRKSSSSLTNVSTLLSMAKLNSNTELSGLKNSTSGASGRRASSISQTSVPKFAVKPDINYLTVHKHLQQEFNQELKLDEETVKYNNIEGAIFTNDMQQKSYYILWTIIKTNLVVIGVGEMQFDLFGAVGNPGGLMGGVRRRGSSFTGINELGGFNFQDLDILFSIACDIGTKTSVKDKSSIYVTVNDLPNAIPLPMLNDYFLHYLPKTFNSGGESADKVEVLAHGTEKLGILPMVKMFGSESSDFELDWVGNGMWSWL